VDTDSTDSVITGWRNKLISVNNARQMRPQRLVGDNVAVLSDRTLEPVYTAGGTRCVGTQLWQM